MKRIGIALCLALAAAFTASAAEDIVVGVTPFPHKDIMEIAKPLLAKEGYNLVIREFTDYVQPNMALAERQIFANFFQHIPYFDNMNQERNLNLEWIAKVHIEPMGLYSKKITSLDELKAGSIIAVPNDPTNEARSLRLLEAHGLIKLKPGELVT
ncbi:MAG: MetQ/NlpA family ABC transporter substrate-binding protein, partial [Planctomycetes bacterium]|nr:MetQ/NlpA family ABC transporter substrate-binding protein [Planctomycetota bacterium]